MCSDGVGTLNYFVMVNTHDFGTAYTGIAVRCRAFRMVCVLVSLAGGKGGTLA